MRASRGFLYKRHGTLSLLAGIDLLTGKVHALVRERHRSREFIEFLKLLDAACGGCSASSPNRRSYLSVSAGRHSRSAASRRCWSDPVRPPASK